MKYLRTGFLVLLTAIVSSCGSQKREFDPEYVEVTNQRAQNIVDEMNFADVDKKMEVRNLIATQYRNLSWVQDGRDEEIEAIKNNSNLSEEDKKEKIARLEGKAEKEIADLHKEYIKELNKELTSEQVDAVKDGMTYGVVPKTYNAYMAMLPNLKKEEREFIHSNLVEAREHAMDAGSSHKKHWWFNKYKGKITNYLSQAGYDLEQAEAEWLEREKAKKEN